VPGARPEEPPAETWDPPAAPGARPEEPPAETCKVPEHDCDVTGLELELKPSAGPSDVKAKRCKNCKKWYAVDELATDAKQEPGAEG